MIPTTQFFYGSPVGKSHDLVLHILDVQNVVLGAAAVATSNSLPEMQNLRFYPRLTESGPKMFLNSLKATICSMLI